MGRFFSRPQVAEVDAADADAAVRRDEAVLLDVREAAEWQAGHAPDALHLPLGELSPEQLPRDRRLIAVCRSGGRSASAAARLLSAGFDVQNLAGGMESWARAGLPVIRDDGRPGTVA